MDRTQFKLRMKSLKSYREQNPGKGYWDWKIYAFENGGETIPIRGTSVYNNYGDTTHYIPASLEDNTLNLSLPDVVITTRNNLNLASVVTEGRNKIGRAGGELLSMITPVGDVELVYEIGKDISTGDYSLAALGASLLLLPNVIGKPIKKFIKAKLLSDAIDNSNIVANSLLPKPKVRTRVGDIEIDNPLLYYRLGSKEMADDFLNTGIVDTDGAFANPMFARGHLWYGIPKRMTKRENTEVVTRRGLKFNFGKRNEDVPKTHLLISNPSTNMIGSDHHARPANTLVYKLRNAPINDADIPRYNQDLGEEFVSKYLDAYYNGELEDRMATIVTYPGGSRRIPATHGAANKSNTWLYEYDPNYGYRLVKDNSKVYNSSISEYNKINLYENGGEILPTRGTTVTNMYGDKTHYVATSMDDDGTLNLSLPDIEITPRNNLNLAGSVSKAMDNAARSGVNMAMYVTPLGDVEDAYNIAKDINIGNYGLAALGIGLMALPNFIEKPLRRVGKLLKKSKKVIDELSLDDVKNWTDTDWDFNYNLAIKNNDTEKIQKLRDLHFKVKAPNTVFEGHYYHGSGKSFNIFDPAKIGNTDKGWLGRGYYFTPSEDYAKMYGNTKKFYLNASNPMEGKGIAWFNREDINPILLRNPNIREAVERGRLADAARGSMPLTKPYDGYFEEDVMKYNTQMKLADPITYDDSGDIIPLSKRDNFGNPDIRYGLIPLIGFSTLDYNNGESTQKYKDGGEVEPPYPQFVNGRRVNRWTGQPIATGQATPVFDLRDAADFTPAGDVLAVKDTYEAVLNNDWVGAGLAAIGVLPFVPSVTKKLRREIPTVNKNYVSDVIDALDRQRYNKSSAEAAMNNETYEIVQRLMDDPSYIRRANEVKYRYGDDYLSTYADLINAYNYSPELLPKAKVTKFEDARRAQMIATPESANRHRQGGEFPTLGEYEYQFDPDNAVEGMTLHELDHLVDFLKNKVPDADGNSNMFYRMRLSLKPYSDGISKYYSNPTEQKAYMNQLREFMYKRGMIKTRDEQVTKEMLQEAMNKLPKSMSSIINASKQFKSMRAYTKWFNQIPLLTAGALGINRYYNQQQEQ